MKRVAVVGSGISGLAAARALEGLAQVTLFEAGRYFGGHAHTVDVTLGGVTHGVDTGFLVFNHRTYPHLVRLFEELGVVTAASEMSFSVQVPEANLEWSGCNLNSVFAQRRNLLSPRFWALLADILRFNKLCTTLAEQDSLNKGNELLEPIGDFLDRHRFDGRFRDWYLLPMLGCIWSCPTDSMLRFPLATMIRFCHNHGLIQVNNRPQWFTVRGGARHYVERMLKQIPDARLNCPVQRVQRQYTAEGRSTGVMVHTEHNNQRFSERFDEVVLACHSDQALALLGDARAAEREVLAAIRYHPNRAVLHTDTSVLPRRKRAWAAWNYARAQNARNEASAVCLHYLINRLQPLPWQQPVLVSLNPDPAREPAPQHVLGDYNYSHPVFDAAAVRAQHKLPSIQGTGGVWFCGAWTRYGFHEDGLMSALEVVRGLRESWQNQGASRWAA